MEPKQAKSHDTASAEYKCVMFVHVLLVLRSVLDACCFVLLIVIKVKVKVKLSHECDADANGKRSIAVTHF
jgi:hypothetical protein